MNGALLVALLVGYGCLFRLAWKQAKKDSKDPTWGWALGTTCVIFGISALVGNAIQLVLK